MLITALAMLTVVSDDRLPRPTDEELRALVSTQRPGGRLIALAFSDSPRGGGRIGCGTVELDGVVEPIAVITGWQEARTPVLRIIGSPPPATEPAHWDSRIISASRSDRDADGEISRYDRNADTWYRRLAMQLCPDLAPPPGVNWITEFEPDPDPERAARARRWARSSSDLLFGTPSAASQPDR